MTQKKEQHKILINAVDPEECRIALLKGSRLESFLFETDSRDITRVRGIVPSNVGYYLLNKKRKELLDLSLIHI
jgi:hypothetical protein